MREVLLVGVGGALGAMSRYGVSRAMIRLIGESFPYGTLVVNCLGSLLIGLLMQTLLGSDLVPSSLRLALIVGFLGAFTTFSAFSYETVTYFKNGSWHLGAANIAANVVLGIGFVLLGMAIARYVFKVA
ncbi:MAG: fluoride efflux transporter CrcB [Chloroflexi bacterium]|jgi:fluoride exporter|nr:fluoride efflux transporter CrcB [Chloroflexota bacterium]MBT7080983.1 fluoride efflux transporter CrcB [Chloroflexota bacterium]MBT7290532.1 fluoride efflux transporter CrcB [Chloroflexota bacterium]